MLAAEVDVEGDELGDQRTAAAARVLDRLDRGRKVGAWGVQGYRDRGPPPLQQRVQVVQKRVVGVRRVRHALPAVDLPLEVNICVIVEYSVNIRS